MSNHKVYNKQNREWMNVEYFEIYNMEDEQVGTGEAETADWMDEIDILSAKTEALTIWASDNGYDVDDLYYE